MHEDLGHSKWDAGFTHEIEAESRHLGINSLRTFAVEQILGVINRKDIINRLRVPRCLAPGICRQILWRWRKRLIGACG
jgi:hypothetical protein